MYTEMQLGAHCMGMSNNQTEGKRNRNVMRIEYFLDIAGMPHIHAMMRDNVS